jgi:hypothetical protein
MFFQLLHGIHTELGKKYQAVMDKNDKGERVYVSQPVVESKQDLVALFGSNKFRRLSDNEANLLLKTDDNQSPGQPVSPDTSPGVSAVAEAAKQGAAGTAEFPGREVTHKFPRTRQMNMQVFYKDHKYIITDLKGKILTTDGPLTRNQVNEFITEHLE